MIEEENLTYNPVKGSVRAYLDASNDYENPILHKMSELENKINSKLLQNPIH